jgi:hypothetical protein
MFFFAQSSTLNHKPQLGPQHRHHHDEVRKNGISYAVGLMRSIAYRQICLVNRKTAIVAKMTPHVGISCELRKPFVHRWAFLRSTLGCVTIRPCVMVEYGVEYVQWLKLYNPDFWMVFLDFWYINYIVRIPFSVGVFFFVPNYTNSQIPGE